MIFESIAQFFTLVACVMVVIVTEPALNRCHVKRTSRCIRVSLLLICAGALLIAASIIPDVLPSPWPGAAALSSGIALLLFSTRRRRVFHGTF